MEDQRAMAMQTAQSAELEKATAAELASVRFCLFVKHFAIIFPLSLSLLEFRMGLIN